MRQVPHYLLIGRGRLAVHFQHYFNLLQLSSSIWHRGLPFEQLYAALPQASHVLILINDDAIEAFIKEHLLNRSHAYLIHCSGRLTSHLAIGAHPLMTFGKTLYALDDYQVVPFVLEEGAPAFSTLFPGLSNPTITIKKSLKEKYHALCALSGGLTCYLWQQLFGRFEQEFSLPRNIVFPYLKQQVSNILTDAEQALTGPIVRGDVKTIEAHLTALSQDSLRDLYLTFLAGMGYQQKGEVV